MKMKRQNILMFLIVIILLYLVVNYFLESQQETDEQDLEVLDTEIDEELVVEEQEEEEEKYKNFYKVPSSLWPKITIGGTISAVIVYVALLYGISSYFIGYRSGGKVNKGNIFASIGLAIAVAILGRSATIFFQVKLYELLLFLFPDHKLISGTISDIIVYVIWITFIVGIAVYVYETFTVTAEEAHPTK